MAHAGQERRLGLVGFFCGGQCFAEGAICCQSVPHFGVDVCEPQTDRMNNMIVTVVWMTDTCHAQHFIILGVISSDQITIGDDVFCSQCFTYVVWLSKLSEPFLVVLIHIEITVFPDPFLIRKMFTFRNMGRIVRICTIANRLVGINIHVIYAAIIRRHGRDHTVQVFVLFFPGKNLFCNV